MDQEWPTNREFATPWSAGLKLLTGMFVLCRDKTASSLLNAFPSSSRNTTRVHSNVFNTDFFIRGIITVQSSCRGSEVQPLFW